MVKDDFKVTENLIINTSKDLDLILDDSLSIDTTEDLELKVTENLNIDTTNDLDHKIIDSLSIDTTENSELKVTENLNIDSSINSDTAPVPVPAAAWLLISGIFSLGFIRRRKNSA